jgi:putative NADPH-quinone reductase
MNVLIVLAHPEPKSFNGALFDTAVRTFSALGDAVVTSDLYRMRFDPVSDRHNFRTVKDPSFLKLQIEETYATERDAFVPEIETEIRKIEACDLMILQFPLWWFGLPAILKGWADRVLAMGRTYGYGNIYATGKFRGKRALLSLTTGGLPRLTAKAASMATSTRSFGPYSAGSCSSSGSMCLRRRSITARCASATRSASNGSRSTPGASARLRARRRSRLASTESPRRSRRERDGRWAGASDADYPRR